jgi:protein-ribulosamine 3-kinase
MIDTVHPLENLAIVAAIEDSASLHLGRRWSSQGFRALDDRASHPCGIHRGDGFDVFVKFCADANGANQFELECRGLQLLREHGARAASPVADGVLQTEHATLLLLEAMTERASEDRTTSDWQSIGHTLGLLHEVSGSQFGLDKFDGYFGPIFQDNRPVATNTWIDFLRERRIEPFLRQAIDAGQLPPEFVARITTFAERLHTLAGPDPTPSLLHGDAQQNNYLSTDVGAVIVDASPFFGHPETDLAMIDMFDPVPNEVFDGYRDVRAIDLEFERRRELWRVPVYLAIIAVDGRRTLGRRSYDDSTTPCTHLPRPHRSRESRPGHVPKTQRARPRCRREYARETESRWGRPGHETRDARIPGLRGDGFQTQIRVTNPPVHVRIPRRAVGKPNRSGTHVGRALRCLPRRNIAARVCRWTTH